MWKNPVRWCVTIAAAAAGCASTPTHETLSAFLKAHEHTVSGTEARIGAADTLGLSAPRVLEIDGETQTVRPDGKIKLRLIGEVKVAGLTERELATKLKELLSPYYREPQVQVRIVNQPNRVYYVLGQVGGAGTYRYTGRDTVMDALVRSAPTNIAWQSRVKVIRPSPFPEARRQIEINVDKMLKTGDTRMNVLLEPGDIVYVPPTPLGWVALKIEELLHPVTPVIRAGTAPAAVRAIPDVYDEDRSGTIAVGFN